MLQSLKVLILLLLLTSISLEFGGMQSFYITGRLMCRGKPAPFAELKLINTHGEKETLVLAEDVFTDPGGQFQIYGYQFQFVAIDAAVWVYHECFYDVGIHHGLCKSKMEMDVPAEFRNYEKYPKKVFNAGTIDLENGVQNPQLEKSKLNREN